MTQPSDVLGRGGACCLLTAHLFVGVDWLQGNGLSSASSKSKSPSPGHTASSHEFVCIPETPSSLFPHSPLLLLIQPRTGDLCWEFLPLPCWSFPPSRPEKSLAATKQEPPIQTSSPWQLWALLAGTKDWIAAFPHQEHACTPPEQLHTYPHRQWQWLSPEMGLA